MNYVITDFDKAKGTVSLTVTWDDGTTYDKRMMCDLSSEESINNTILGWLKDYLPVKEAQKDSYDPTALVGQSMSLEQVDVKGVKSLTASVSPISKPLGVKVGL